MDATNLALCFAPVLIRSQDLTRDVHHCRIPSAQVGTGNARTEQAGQSPTQTTTLASLLMIMISRYHEVFDIDSGSYLDPFARSQSLVVSNDRATPSKASGSNRVHQDADIFSTQASPTRATRGGTPRRRVTAPTVHSGSGSPLSSPGPGTPPHQVKGDQSFVTASPSSGMSFGVSDGRKSLKLLKGRKSDTAATTADVTHSPISVLGLLGDSPSDQDAVK